MGSWNGSDHLASASMAAEDLNTWVHLAGVFDGTAWRLYRNGVQIAEQSESTGAVTVAGNWAIGSRGTGSERFFAGNIDEVRIYNTALNAESVAALAAEQGHSPLAQDRTLLVPDEISDGYVAGHVPFSDADGAEPHTFTILSGNDDGLFSISTSGQIIVEDAEGLADAELAVHQLVVRVADADDSSRQSTATVAIGRVWMVSLQAADTLEVAQKNGDFNLSLNAFTLPNLSWVIDWGDGTIETFASGTTLATHQYQAEGEFEISAEVGDQITMVAAPMASRALVSQLPGINLLINGSFEKSAINAEGARLNYPLWDLLGANTTYKDEDDRDQPLPLLGWTVTSASGKLEIQRDGLFTGFHPHSGAQYAEMDGDQNGHSGDPVEGEETGHTTIEQTFSTRTGAGYQLRFFVGGRPGTAAEQNQVRVKLFDVSNPETPVLILNVTSPMAEAGTWAEQFTNFQAPGTRTKVEFSAMGPDDTLGAFLDDVSVILDSPRDHVIEGRRIANGPVEEFFAVKPNEHFEIGGKFDFRVTGPFTDQPVENIKWQIVDYAPPS